MFFVFFVIITFMRKNIFRAFFVLALFLLISLLLNDGVFAMNVSARVFFGGDTAGRE